MQRGLRLIDGRANRSDIRCKERSRMRTARPTREVIMVSALQLNTARSGPATRVIAWAVGGMATVVALAVGSILALVFAATLAVVAVLAVSILALAALAFRVRRPRIAPGARGASEILESRKLGHSWVVYGWDQPS